MQDPRARLDPGDPLASRVRRGRSGDEACKDHRGPRAHEGLAATRETRVSRDSRGRMATREPRELPPLAHRVTRDLPATRARGAPRGLRVFAAPRDNLDLVVLPGRLD